MCRMSTSVLSAVVHMSVHFARLLFDDSTDNYSSTRAHVLHLQ